MIQKIKVQLKHQTVCGKHQRLQEGVLQNWHIKIHWDATDVGEMCCTSHRMERNRKKSRKVKKAKITFPFRTRSEDLCHHLVRLQHHKVTYTEKSSGRNFPPGRYTWRRVCRRCWEDEKLISCLVSPHLSHSIFCGA